MDTCSLSSSDGIAYSFGGQDGGLVTLTFPENAQPDTKRDSLALGLITTQKDGVLLRITSGNSNDYIEMEMVGGASSVLQCPPDDQAWLRPSHNSPPSPLLQARQAGRWKGPGSSIGKEGRAAGEVGRIGNEGKNALIKYWPPAGCRSFSEFTIKGLDFKLSSPGEVVISFAFLALAGIARQVGGACNCGLLCPSEARSVFDCKNVAWFSDISLKLQIQF